MVVLWHERWYFWRRGSAGFIRGGAFCGDVVFFTERCCFLLGGSVRTSACVYTPTAHVRTDQQTRCIQRRCQAAPTNLFWAGAGMTDASQGELHRIAVCHRWIAASCCLQCSAHCTCIHMCVGPRTTSQQKAPPLSKKYHVSTKSTTSYDTHTTFKNAHYFSNHTTSLSTHDTRTTPPS